MYIHSFHIHSFHASDSWRAPYHVSYLCCARGVVNLNVVPRHLADASDKTAQEKAAQEKEHCPPLSLLSAQSSTSTMLPIPLSGLKPSDTLFFIPRLYILAYSYICLILYRARSALCIRRVCQQTR